MVLAAAALVLLGACPGPRRRPNVVLIVVDTLRADRLGCYGYSRPTSPAIDALATRSVRFERAYAPASWTSPSVVSLLTGRYPSGHGVTKVIVWLQDEIPTLAEVLREAGYATSAVVSNIFLNPRLNFHQGFEQFDESEGRHDHQVDSMPGVTAKGVAAIEALAGKEKPFFLFLHYMDPHYDYLPHPEFGFAAPRAGRLDGTQEIRTIWEMLDGLTPEELGFLGDLYDGEVSHTDEGVARVLAAIRKQGIDDDTIVVFVADHGEDLLEHGWLGHGRSLYDNLVRVPLLVRPAAGGPAPRTVEQAVSTTSVMATILDLAGVAAGEIGLQAPSLLPEMQGERRSNDAFCEVDQVPIKESRWQPETHQKAVVVGHLKLIRDDPTGRLELYDLKSDPGETSDIAAANPDLVRRLQALLEQRIALSRAPGTGQLAGDLPEEDLQRLEALGYIDR